MKSFKDFCVDANIQEFWNPFAPKPKPKPNTKVLAYKNYKSGELDKSTGKFTQRAHTPSEQQRYGWKPRELTTYNPTGRLTASGKPFTNTTPPSVAVPWRSKDDKRPKIPFGTKIQFTNKPMGNATQSITAVTTDTGNFGRKDSESTNKDTFADASPSLRRKLVPGSTSTTFGKHKTYVKYNPDEPKIPDLGFKVDMTTPKIIPTKKR